MIDHRQWDFRQWVFLVVIIVCATTVGAFGVKLVSLDDSASRNHRTLCLLNRLFGLDRPLPPSARKKLTHTQVIALKEFIASCPELQRR